MSWRKISLGKISYGNIYRLNGNYYLAICNNYSNSICGIELNNSSNPRANLVMFPEKFNNLDTPVEVYENENLGVDNSRAIEQNTFAQLILKLVGGIDDEDEK